MNRHQRIELIDSPLDAIVKLSEGNPGALSAIMKLMDSAEKIDPDSAFGSLSPLFSLDAMGIYGSKIWTLWKDVCAMDPIKVQTLMRAVQLGHISEIQVIGAVDSKNFDFPAINQKVRETIPAFSNLNEVAA